MSSVWVCGRNTLTFVICFYIRLTYVIAVLFQKTFSKLIKRIMIEPFSVRCVCFSFFLVYFFIIIRQNVISYNTVCISFRTLAFMQACIHCGTLIQNNIDLFKYLNHVMILVKQFWKRRITSKKINK